MKLNVAIRIALTGYLLIVIWCQNHWSIALAVTLLAFQTEISSLSIRELAKQIRMRKL